MELKCRDCGKTFIFSDVEQRRFAAMGWAKPIRCQQCRKYQGWRSTMTGHYQKRTRHSRVPYAPHVVGGFR